MMAKSQFRSMMLTLGAVWLGTMMWIFSSVHMDARWSEGQEKRLPKIHVINVAGQYGEGRRQNIAKTMGTYPYELVAAHVPKTPIVQKQGCNDFNMTQGNMALVRSHSSLYQRLLASEAPWIIIAEDDIELVSNFKSQLPSVLTQMRTIDFDIIKLEYCNKEPMTSTNITIQTGQGDACTALYIVSREGAKLLLAVNPPETPCLVSDGAMDPPGHPDAWDGHRQSRWGGRTKKKAFVNQGTNIGQTRRKNKEVKKVNVNRILCSDGDIIELVAKYVRRTGTQ